MACSSHDFIFFQQYYISTQWRSSMAKRSNGVKPILAAGGIVVREAPEPLIAIVRLRKDKAWVLPKGKLKANEDALAAARREVLEETGHDVSVHEFLGAMSHAAGGKLKVVQFWRMRASGAPVRKLMRDVKAVRWLPLEQAIETLTHAHEQAFLANVGPVALAAAERSARDTPGKPTGPLVDAETAGRAARVTLLERIRAWFQRMTQGRA
jgi:8-oxo-dGTP diphosphatase